MVVCYNIPIRRDNYTGPGIHTLPRQCIRCSISEKMFKNSGLTRCLTPFEHLHLHNSGNRAFGSICKIWEIPLHKFNTPQRGALALKIYITVRRDVVF